MMNKYELALVVSAKLDDETRAGVVDRAKEYITRFGGSLGETEEWGKRRLAYEIDDELDAEGLNPVLMVKDFDASGDFCTDETFMTNADVPSIALEGMVADPVNPFTGQRIDDSAKTETGEVIVTSAFIWDINVNRGQVFDTSDGYFYSVHGDIYDKNNWTLIGEGY